MDATGRMHDNPQQMFSREQIEAIHELIGTAIKRTAGHMAEDFVGRDELTPIVEDQLGNRLISLRDGRFGAGKYLTSGPEGCIVGDSGSKGAAELPDGTANYQVMLWDNTAEEWTVDYPRWVYIE